MSFERLVARLAGGLVEPIGRPSLRVAARKAAARTQLGELDRIKPLPGFADAAADTLLKAWRAGIDLGKRAAEHRRIASVAALERAVLASLPSRMKPPADLAAAAMKRLHCAYRVLGPVEIVGITELSPCWRRVVCALSAHTPVTWHAGVREAPKWLEGSAVRIESQSPSTPKKRFESAATPLHEAVEALRWVRRLLATGQAKPQDIAVCAASVSEYDDHFLALGSDASFEFHFVHGVKVTTTRAGQAAAALADILLRGLSRSRMRRLASLLPKESSGLPRGWVGALPHDDPLATPEAWHRVLARPAVVERLGGDVHVQAVRRLIELLAPGVKEYSLVGTSHRSDSPASDETALQIGASLLDGKASSIWKRALANGSVAALDRTLERLSTSDGLEPADTVVWAAASEIAQSPRRYVRLLGLNSTRWPRVKSEDRLLSDHVIASDELDPFPLDAADRRDYDTILKTTERLVVCSLSRWDGSGRRLGISALLHDAEAPERLSRSAAPKHAFGEVDRLLARSDEFRRAPRARLASMCWTDWTGTAITPHDGLVRADHPLILRTLGLTQSASSLSQLLRNPLGYVWRRGLGWKSPVRSAYPLVLDALAKGNLVHEILEDALGRWEGPGGGPTAELIRASVEEAVRSVAASWEEQKTIPPKQVWQHTLREARDMAMRGSRFEVCGIAGRRSWAEVPFGGMRPESDGNWTWDTEAVVEMPETGFRIRGVIDRIDLSADGRSVCVIDYKTGAPPKKAIVLAGGKELQRCCYAVAARSLLGSDADVSAALLYLKNGSAFALGNVEDAIAQVSAALRAADSSLRSGTCVVGEDARGRYDDLALALPALHVTNWVLKKEAAKRAWGEASKIWDAL